MPRKFLSVADVASVLGVSVASVNRYRAQDGFPRPAYSGKSLGWSFTSIEAWLRRRAS